MLEVGTNSYVTIAEADEYLSGEITGERWEVLSTQQKERYLITAARHIDGLMLRGCKASPTQPMFFPRTPNHGMEAVQQAQMLEALALTDSTAKQRRELQAQGVKAISVGSASESYVDSGASALASREAIQLLRPYLVGSVRMV